MTTWQELTKEGKYKEITDYNKTKLWNEAVKKAKDYISQLLVIRKLNEKDIKKLAEEQKIKLIE